MASQEELERALRVMHEADVSNAERQEATMWALRMSQRADAWGPLISVLQNESLHHQLFAANSLTGKVQRDWAKLTDDARATLPAELWAALQRHAASHAAVVHQLCRANAFVAIQERDGISRLLDACHSWVGEQLSSVEKAERDHRAAAEEYAAIAMSAVVCVLEALPQVVEEADVSKARHRELLQVLEHSVPHVLSLLDVIVSHNSSPCQARRIGEVAASLARAGEDTSANAGGALMVSSGVAGFAWTWNALYAWQELFPRLDLEFLLREHRPLAEALLAGLQMPVGPVMSAVSSCLEESLRNDCARRIGHEAMNTLTGSLLSAAPVARAAAQAGRTGFLRGFGHAVGALVEHGTQWISHALVREEGGGASAARLLIELVLELCAVPEWGTVNVVLDAVVGVADKSVHERHPELQRPLFERIAAILLLQNQYPAGWEPPPAGGGWASLETVTSVAVPGGRSVEEGSVSEGLRMVCDAPEMWYGLRAESDNVWCTVWDELGDSLLSLFWSAGTPTELLETDWRALESRLAVLQKIAPKLTVWVRAQAAGGRGSEEGRDIAWRWSRFVLECAQLPWDPMPLPVLRTWLRLWVAFGEAIPAIVQLEGSLPLEDVLGGLMTTLGSIASAVHSRVEAPRSGLEAEADEAGVLETEGFRAGAAEMVENDIDADEEADVWPVLEAAVAALAQVARFGGVHAAQPAMLEHCAQLIAVIAPDRVPLRCQQDLGKFAAYLCAHVSEPHRPGAVAAVLNAYAHAVDRAVEMEDDTLGGERAARSLLSLEIWMQHLRMALGLAQIDPLPACLASLEPRAAEWMDRLGRVGTRWGHTRVGGSAAVRVFTQWIIALDRHVEPFLEQGMNMVMTVFRHTLAPASLQCATSAAEILFTPTLAVATPEETEEEGRRRQALESSFGGLVDAVVEILQSVGPDLEHHPQVVGGMLVFSSVLARHAPNCVFSGSRFTALAQLSIAAMSLSDSKARTSFERFWRTVLQKVGPDPDPASRVHREVVDRALASGGAGILARGLNRLAHARTNSPGLEGLARGLGQICLYTAPESSRWFFDAMEAGAAHSLERARMEATAEGRPQPEDGAPDVWGGLSRGDRESMAQVLSTLATGGTGWQNRVWQLLHDVGRVLRCEVDKSELLSYVDLVTVIEIE